MGHFLKIVIGGCAVGIVGVMGTLILLDPAPEPDIAPVDTTPTLDLVFTDESVPDGNPN